MAGYRRGEREQVWREVIRDQAASGLSISAFCRDREVSPASFFNWRRKLADRADATHHGQASKFVALDFSVSSPAVTEAGSPATPRTALRTDCEIVLANGCRVIVPVQCDAGWLREVLAVVQETSGAIPQALEAGRSC